MLCIPLGVRVTALGPGLGEAVLPTAPCGHPQTCGKAACPTGVCTKNCPTPLEGSTKAWPNFPGFYPRKVSVHQEMEKNHKERERER